MKLVHVVETLDVGGLERVVLSLADWQRRQGDSSHIVCLFHEGVLAAEARAQGISVAAMGKRRGLDGRALWRLRTVLAAADADVIHTHNAVAHYYTAAATLGLRVDRLINTRHGLGPAHAGRLERLYRLALIGTEVATTVCQAGRERFVCGGVIPAAKAAVVPNGAEVSGIQVRSDEARQRLLAQLNRPLTSMVIGSVGRLSAVKDQATLMSAFGLLCVATPEAELVLVGDGPDRATLQQHSQSLGLNGRVHFLGQRRDVAQLLPAFDVFVNSSASEGYSLALVEAAAAALPIVATRVGGNAEIVEHERTGLLVPARDATALAQALARLAADAALRGRLGAAGRQWALRCGSVEAMGQAYRAIYLVGTAAALHPAGRHGRPWIPGGGA